MEQVVLKPQNFSEQLRILANDLTEARPIQERLKEASEQDSTVKRILDAVRQGTSIREFTVTECLEKAGQLYYRGKRYVPEDPELQLHLIKEHHDTPLAGHPERSKTFDLLSQQ